AVKVWSDGSGNLVLTAYVVAAGFGNLRVFLQDKLPDYMIPSRFVRVDELPLTPNLKVDRNCLPRPETFSENATFVPPINAIQRKIAAIWESILGVKQVGATDNFFELGGHSLLIPKLLIRVDEAFGLRLPMSSVFESSTLAEFAARIDRDNSP